MKGNWPKCEHGMPWQKPQDCQYKAKYVLTTPAEHGKFICGVHAKGYTKKAYLEIRRRGGSR